MQITYREREKSMKKLRNWYFFPHSYTCIANTKEKKQKRDKDPENGIRTKENSFPSHRTYFLFTSF